MGVLHGCATWVCYMGVLHGCAAWVRYLL